MRASFLRLIALTLSCSHGEAARPSRSVSAVLQQVAPPVIPGLSWVSMSYFLPNTSAICVSGTRVCPEVEYHMFGWEPPYLAPARRSTWGWNNYICCGPAFLNNIEEISTLEGNTTLSRCVIGLISIPV